MVQINYKIVIVGMICLTVIYIGLLVTGHCDGTITAMIVGIIGVAIGVIIPSPTINRKGVLKW